MLAKVLKFYRLYSLLFIYCFRLFQKTSWSYLTFRYFCLILLAIISISCILNSLSSSVLIFLLGSILWCLFAFFIQVEIVFLILLTHLYSLVSLRVSLVLYFEFTLRHFITFSFLCNHLLEGDLLCFFVGCHVFLLFNFLVLKRYHYVSSSMSTSSSFIEFS